MTPDPATLAAWEAAEQAAALRWHQVMDEAEEEDARG